MPWTAADADKHVKGLSPAKKRAWAVIANSALKSCESSGKSNCDGYALATAASRVRFVKD